MKRYDLESTGWDHEEMVERPLGDWCEWDEVDAERAKDRKNYEDALTDMVKEKNDEIARLRKALECIWTEIKGKYTLTGLFDLIENLAREALEGE